jgi:hypothetical protein
MACLLPPDHVHAQCLKSRKRYPQWAHICRRSKLARVDLLQSHRNRCFVQYEPGLETALGLHRQSVRTSRGSRPYTESPKHRTVPAIITNL